MAGIMADHNIEGHFRLLVGFWERPPWREMWTELALSVESFASLGLAPDVNDAELWEVCQRANVVLLTANRNADEPDSLEMTIRERNRDESLPVLTIANPTRLLQDRTYAEEVAMRILEYLLDLENYRGTGRLYV
jgi:hypothetical protein